MRYIPNQIIHDQLLKEISETFLILNRSKNIKTDIPKILEKIGNATKVDRVYIFKKIKGNNISYIYEWNNQNVLPQIDFEPLQNLPMNLFPDLNKLFEDNLPINDYVSNSKNDWFRELMEEQQIISYLFMPILVQNKFWGFIGFDNCSSYKLFTDGQISALQSLAEVIGNVLYTFKVSKQKRKAEKREKETLTLFEILSKNVEDIIFLLDENLKIIYYSPAFEKLTKESIEDNQSFTELFKIEINELTKIKIDSNHKIITENYFSKINKIIAIEHIIKPLDNFNNLGKYIVSSREVTEREKLLKNIKINLNKERELNKLKSKFISMTSHELRTPLATILSSVDLLEIISESLIDQAHRENLMKHIRKIQIQINRLNHIISEVFILEKSSSNDYVARVETFEINDVIKQILFNYCKDASNKFELNLHSSPIIIKTDKDWFINILRNIIENAIKYGKPHLKKPKISSSIIGKKIQLIIEDFGIGIPKADQAFIFDSFFRSSNVLNMKGTGLGLTIVKELVNKLNGQITFTSSEGFGTKFVIEFPNEKNNTPC
ncbi:sensor histidine kinase [Algoriphagus marincola]|uniref:sensor histidine kinase n=1 Tax=Algoriphagus marincola TaxID=264027 RepID=UPI0004276DDD|nr:ATP-binding protein [Algoriphagus marincola]